jgi:hypothetical protein
MLPHAPFLRQDCTRGTTLLTMTAVLNCNRYSICK